MWRVAFLTVCLSSPVGAETDVPRLADGTVDVGAVMSSFQIANTVTTDGASDAFEGTFLGSGFAASVSTAADGASNLTVASGQLSEEATFMVAVLLADIVCLKRNLRPAPLQWKETAARVEDGWQVDLECRS